MKNSNTASSLKSYKKKQLIRNKTKSLNESTIANMLESPIKNQNTYTQKQKTKKIIKLNLKPPKSKRDIPLPTNYSSKNLNSSNKQEQTLTAEISLSSICSTEDPAKKKSSNKKMNSILKTHDEILELQLTNSRLQNEIMILNEKNNTLNNIINIKNTECDILKNKYTSLIDELTQENQNLKQKNENDSSKYQETIDKYYHALNSLVNIVIDICDLMLSKPPAITNSHTNLSTNNNNNDFSLDVYDSFNCDEDKRTSLIEQIQSIILAKVASLKKAFGLGIDQKEIDKINSWNSNYINKKNISNIVNTINTNEDNSNSISKIYLNSNDTSNDFDLSVSGQFINNNNTNNISASPKFNSFDESGNKSTITQKKNLLSELKSSKSSFGDFSSNTNKNQDNTLSQNCINMGDYSIGDIVTNEAKEQNLNQIDSFADIKPPVENNLNNFSVGNIDNTDNQNIN